MPTNDVCNRCGAEIGRGGVGQEDGTILCIRCDLEAAKATNPLDSSARLAVKFFDANNASLELKTQGNQQHGKIAVFAMLLSKAMVGTKQHAVLEDEVKVFVNSLGSMKLIALHDHPSIPRLCEGIDSKPCATFHAQMEMVNGIRFHITQEGNIDRLFTKPLWLVTYLVFKALARDHLGDHRFWRRLVLAARNAVTMAQTGKLEPGEEHKMAAICAMCAFQDLNRSFHKASGGSLSVSAKELAAFTFENPDRKRCVAKLDNATSYAIGYLGNSLSTFVRRQYKEFEQSTAESLREFIDGLLLTGYATGRRCLRTHSSQVNYCTDPKNLDELTGILVEYASDLDSKDAAAPWGSGVTLFLSAAAKGFSEQGELVRIANRQQAEGLVFMIMKRGFSIARAEYDLCT